jgi:anti-anti-sigma factor
MNDGAAWVIVDEGGRCARLGGELDLAAYDMLMSELAPLFDTAGEVTLDLSHVAFIDSSAIRLFVQLQRAGGAAREVVLSHAQPQVSRILEVAGVADLGIRVRPDDG